jgi:hypothetical protein
MANSLNSVIHFTQTLENLKGILSETFKIKYCVERVTDVLSAFPMVSFCDIPMSNIKDHIDSYGSYGIGLSKTWAYANMLNPVLYVSDGSYIDLVLKSQSEKINKIAHSDIPLDYEWLHHFISILSFVKEHKGNITIDGAEKQITFYDEREWRYVPTREECSKIAAPPQIFGPTYKFNKERMNKYLETLRLRFSIEDITYLVVAEDDDVHDLIDHISSVYKSESARKRELLLTKILTRDQIFNDF